MRDSRPMPIDQLVRALDLASARVPRKLGFRFERILPANDVIDGVAVDDELYLRCAQPTMP